VDETVAWATIPEVREIQCTEVWGGTGPCDVSVKLAGARGECWSRVYQGGAAGGDIHFLSVCGMSILSKVVLADVSGHGEETAEVSRIIHDALQESIGAHDNSAMLSHVNEAFLRRRTGDFRFTTMVAAILDSRDRSLVYAYAGHPSILRGTGGRFRPVRPEGGAPPGVPLGIIRGEALRYEQHMTQLAAGDVLVLFTDAFSEARAPGGALLGEEGLIRLLEGAGTMRPAELKEHVLGKLSGELEDDASLVVLEVL
jgi:sigma-B regulation protein RsbU (phosphoserine phosphatase)